MKFRDMLVSIFLAMTLSASLVALQTRTIKALTSEAEIIEAGAPAFLAMNEVDYYKVIKQLGQIPDFVPITKKPEGLSPKAKFGFNLGFAGYNHSWIIDGDDTSGYVFYTDINANGDLSDDPPQKFKLIDGKPTLLFEITAKEKDSDETHPVIMKLVIDSIGQEEGPDKKLVLLMYNRTRRRGQFLFESGRSQLSFRLTGSSGIYNWDYNSIAFDLDNDGQFDPDVESYFIFEKYVNIGDVTYEFVVDRYGRSVTLNPLSEKRPARSILKPGYPAPDFTFTDLEGNERRLQDYLGQAVLLNFWSTSCGPSVAALPRLAGLYNIYHPKGFEIIGIVETATPEKLNALIAEKQIKWSQAIEDNQLGPIFRLYRIHGTPSYFLIGADGKIIIAAPGGGNLDLEGELAKVFSENRRYKD
jgi:thiol-disulfide isomerase/thioredoxin